MEIISKAKFVKSTPDKIRILSGLLKGQPLDSAIAQLSFSGRDAAQPLILVIKQMKAQIKDKDLNVDDFKIKTIQVDEGPKLKRRRIVHQGRSTMILKRMAHIKITAQGNINLEEKNGTKDKSK